MTQALIIGLALISLVFGLIIPSAVGSANTRDEDNRLERVYDESSAGGGRYSLIFRGDHQVQPLTAISNLEGYISTTSQLTLYQTALNGTPSIMVPYDNGTIRSLADEPFHLIVLVDNSYSMRDNRSDLSRSIDRFLRETGRSDIPYASRHIALWSFSNTLKIEQPFTANRGEILDAFEGMGSPSGGTCLYDALAAARETLKQADADMFRTRRAILVLTDGRDELQQGAVGVCSQTAPSDLLDVQRELQNAYIPDIPIFALKYPAETSATVEDDMGQELRLVADDSQGQFAEADTLEGSNLFIDLYGHFDNQWQLTLNLYPEKIGDLYLDLDLSVNGLPIVSDELTILTTKSYLYNRAAPSIEIKEVIYHPIDNAYDVFYEDNLPGSQKESLFIRLNSSDPLPVGDNNPIRLDGNMIDALDVTKSHRLTLFVDGTDQPNSFPPAPSIHSFTHSTILKSDAFSLTALNKAWIGTFISPTIPLIVTRKRAPLSEPEGSDMDIGLLRYQGILTRINLISRDASIKSFATFLGGVGNTVDQNTTLNSELYLVSFDRADCHNEPYNSYISDQTSDSDLVHECLSLSLGKPIDTPDGRPYWIGYGNYTLYLFATSNQTLSDIDYGFRTVEINNSLSGRLNHRWENFITFVNGNLLNVVLVLLPLSLILLGGTLLLFYLPRQARLPRLISIHQPTLLIYADENDLPIHFNLDEFFEREGNQSLLIGRSESAVIKMPHNQRASREHAIIVKEENQYHLKDIGSFHGTEVKELNGAWQTLEQDEKKALDKPLTILIGRLPLTFEPGSRMSSQNGRSS
ncbi:MAG: VWA domain-containing protein [Chloroflexota bacterium]